MSYLPHTEEDRRRMLDALGLASLEDLFRHIPESLRYQGNLPLPDGLSEPELVATFETLASRNQTPVLFAGAGAYDVYTPAAVDAILSRPEYFTAYTPYQAEVSQGTLQVLYEFQTLIARLAAMEVAQASMYDGPTALAEAVLMALRLRKHSRRILIPSSLHPHYRRVLDTYLSGLDVTLVEVPYLPSTGQMDDLRIRELLKEGAAAVVVQTPNLFGVLENPYTFHREVHRAEALLISVFDPVSVPITAPPGEYDADIAVAEGQSLGLPLGFGGPYLGLFTTRKTFIRQMPGRLAGMTTDVEGRRGFVMVLQTREQHIRRERATSNICTNQQLMALAATVYLSLVGPEGLREIAEVSHRRAVYLLEEIQKRGLGRRVFEGPMFREFVVELDVPARTVIRHALHQGVFPGVDLGRWGYPETWLLVAVTEKRTPQDLERWLDVMTQALEAA
ncbi:MAG: aminomethyl-transferring glycine dehydrogenase subunit GcvPA [Candidatus Hydrothermae bacterium]|nr:aminomethyl-transferring glycine dehydrogenase subunit GcvPA [Candidatus Hydrothermae bacterium]